MLDEVISILLEIIFAPFHWWRDRHSDSVVGESELDRKISRFWKWFGWIVILIVCGVVFGGIYAAVS